MQHDDGGRAQQPPKGLTALGRVVEQLIIDPDMPAKTIAARTLLNDRTVRRHLAALKAGGGIVPDGYNRNGRVTHRLNPDYRLDGITIREFVIIRRQQQRRDPTA